MAPSAGSLVSNSDPQVGAGEVRGVFGPSKLLEELGFLFGRKHRHARKDSCQEARHHYKLRLTKIEIHKSESLWKANINIADQATLVISCSITSLTPQVGALRSEIEGAGVECCGAASKHGISFAI